ncbi:hypothetical protein ACT2CV_01240 [Pasteurellaceae bacterium 22721_9_1]
MNAIQKFFYAILCIVGVIALGIFILAVITTFRPVLAANTIDQCADKGGIWQTYPTPHCAPPDMTEEQIESAKSYVALKQIETRVINDR